MLATKELIQNYLLNLGKDLEGKPIKKIRASALASYFWCAIQSYLKCCGVEQPRPKEKSHRLNVGSEIHEGISKSRKPSIYEEEFMAKIKPFIDNVAPEGFEIARKWDDDTLIENDDEGWISGHCDELKVNADHTVSLVEYKTKSSPYVDWIDLSPAILQLKIYSWLLEPMLTLIGYRITEATVVFLDRKGYAIGEKRVPINYQEIEREMQSIFDEFKKPMNEMVPPKRFKCYTCAEVYKSRCPYNEK